MLKISMSDQENIQFYLYSIIVSMLTYMVYKSIFRNKVPDDRTIVMKKRCPTPMLFPEDIKLHILSFMRKYGEDYLDKTVEYGTLSKLVSDGTISYDSIISYNMRCLSFYPSQNCTTIKVYAATTNMNTGEIDYFGWDSDEFNDCSLPLMLEKNIQVAYIRKRNNIKKWKNGTLLNGKDIILLQAEPLHNVELYHPCVRIPEPPRHLENANHMLILDQMVNHFDFIVIPDAYNTSWDKRIMAFVIDKFNIKSGIDVDDIRRAIIS